MGCFVSVFFCCKVYGSCVDIWCRMDCFCLYGFLKWVEFRLWGVGWYGYYEEGVEGYCFL